MSIKTSQGSLSLEQVDFYNEEGYLVIPNLLNEQDLTAVKGAMNEKVSLIADELLQAGLIHDKLEQRLFEYRLAELFSTFRAEDFL